MINSREYPVPVGCIYISVEAHTQTSPQQTPLSSTAGYGQQHKEQFSEDEENLLNAIFPNFEDFCKELVLQDSEIPLNPGGNEIEVMAAAVAGSTSTFEKIYEQLTTKSPSEEAEIQRMMQNVPNLMPVLMRKLAPIFMQTMAHMNWYEAEDQANFLRSDLSNILPNLVEDLIPRFMQAVPHMNTDIAEKLKKTMETLLPSLSERIVPEIPDNLPSMNTFVEVLQYVIRDLSARTRSLLQHRWPEIKEVLEEIGANFSTWRDMVLNSPSDTWLVRSATQAAIENNTAWKVGSGRDISAAALMLRHAQPRLLEVRLMPSDTVNQDRWTQVIQRRDGDLKLHLHGSRCWDDYLAPLLNTRCRLVYFEGQVATSSSLDALASVACDDAVLHVSVPAPLNFCSLESKCKELWVYAPTLKTDDRGEGVSVLPRLPRPRLILDDIPPESWLEVAQTITTFAPFGNRYELLQLRDCELTDSELDKVVVALQRRGVRTAGDGRSGWVKRLGDGYYELIITDDLPKLTTYKLVD